MDRFGSNRRPLDFKIRPSSDSVGPFTFGTKINDVVHYLRHNRTKFPDNVFFYNEVDPLCMSYLMNIVSSGTVLRFSPISQRLESIKFEDLSKVDVSYHKGSGNTITFSTPENISTLTVIYSTFGPTNLGHFEKDDSQYVLEYPGIVFVFSIPHELLSHTYQHDQHTEPPQELYKIRLKSIYCRSKDPITMYMEKKIWVNIGEGITVMSEGNSNSKVIPFQASVQEVVGALGMPQQIFTKQEDIMSIYKKATRNLSSSKSLDAHHPSVMIDYFFNYFLIGLDILFDGRTHQVKKFVLRTNLPSQPDFITYYKCHYEINMSYRNKCIEKSSTMKMESLDSLASSDRNASPTIQNTAQLIESSQENAKFGRTNANSKLDHLSELHSNQETEEVDFLPLVENITPETRWKETERLLGVPLGSFWAPSPIGSPFEGTGFYAYQDLIFEVTKKNGYVSKIFLFKS